VYLTKAAADAVVGIYDTGGAVFIESYHIFGTECAADAAALAPVAKDYLIE